MIAFSRMQVIIESLEGDRRILRQAKVLTHILKGLHCISRKHNSEVAMKLGIDASINKPRMTSRF